MAKIVASTIYYHDPELMPKLTKCMNGAIKTYRDRTAKNANRLMWAAYLAVASLISAIIYCFR